MTSLQNLGKKPLSFRHYDSRDTKIGHRNDKAPFGETLDMLPEALMSLLFNQPLCIGSDRDGEAQLHAPDSASTQ